MAARAAAYWTPERTRALTSGKRLPFPPAESAPLLRALGLMNGDGSLRTGGEAKYQQINHMIALLEPAFLEVAERASPVRIIDAACGRSYLAFLLAWSFVHRWKRPVEILAIDRNPRLIAKCRTRFELTGLPAVLRFEAAPLEGLDLTAIWTQTFGGERERVRLDALVALHACDTATDEALALAIRMGVGFVAVAPCCHAELARKWGSLADAGLSHAFAPVWRSPHLRRNVGAAVTDAMRASILHAWGYQVTAMEFVPSVHTPRNTLLRAHLRGDALDTRAWAEVDRLRDATGGAGIRLEDAVARPASGSTRPPEG